ncbi:hypothetical protein DRQ33_05650 [bacterium]|mgnify:CR=1 FL=1|nr:MAG: hypothetical protein DRQ33_05650 [bacterium]
MELISTYEHNSSEIKTWNYFYYDERNFAIRGVAGNCSVLQNKESNTMKSGCSPLGFESIIQKLKHSSQ